jgi:hypothetical protein
MMLAEDEAVVRQTLTVLLDRLVAEGRALRPEPVEGRSARASTGSARNDRFGKRLPKSIPISSSPGGSAP